MRREIVRSHHIRHLNAEVSITFRSILGLVAVKLASVHIGVPQSLHGTDILLQDILVP